MQNISVFYILMLYYRKTLKDKGLISLMVPRMRLERMTLWLKVKCSTNWANEALNKIYVAASARFELANATVKVWCLTAWLRGNFRWWKEMESNHRTRRNRFTVCRVWPLRYPSVEMVPKAGLEPATYWLQVSCSTSWAISAK